MALDFEDREACCDALRSGRISPPTSSNAVQDPFAWPVGTLRDHVAVVASMASGVRHEQRNACQRSKMRPSAHGRRGLRFPGGAGPESALVVESCYRPGVAAA